MVRAFLISILAFFPIASKADAVLLMAQEPGCYWCEQWDKEIGPIYPKSAEGRAVPLRRFDILDPPDDVILARRVHFTPTFILAIDGVETGRIEGYPGEDFFWGLLGNMLSDAQIALEPLG
ncbi:Regulatory protein SoxS [Candidatus Rhodobacter oscarellae]|uniref:Regulatory protein SoxS n=1 Tax=Candidatus Rhodobacter oscarellae TaxID=1675527 RepID=A0A0J9EDF7_9RHOB|nr:Regulatory protein SoxS [Candidatus Rhodobacter lobularis]